MNNKNESVENFLDMVESLAYGSDSTDINGKWDARADLNNNGKVNIADFNLLKQNYGR